MNIRIVLNYVGHILRIEGLSMIPALLIALYKGEHASFLSFAVTIALLALLGTVAVRIKAGDKLIYSREGFAVVALSWISLSFFGAFPFYFSGEIPSFLDSFFETVSGFTTTGSSILTDVEAMPMSLLYWRSFTNWLGGMGVLVFMLAIVPMSKGNGSPLRIMRAESPGPAVEKLVPKLRYTARILYIIYISMTLIEIILLLCGGMPLFDSVLHSFGTAGTGGFSIKNASIGAYDSVYLQGVISVFMLLFGVNFNFYYLILIKKIRPAFKNAELRLYLSIVAVSVAAIAINTRSLFENTFEAFHHSLFQVSSIITTTGYATTDFDLWPQFSRMLLLALMIVGACAGSTGGGIKVARLLILIKAMRNSIQKMIHPRSVKLVKVNGVVVEKEVLAEINVYLTFYTITMLISLLGVSLDDFNLDTNISSVVSCLNNIGPGLGMVGPTGNFSQFSPLSKLVLSADMLIGRLEIFPMILLFAPSSWKRNI